MVEHVDDEARTHASPAPPETPEMRERACCRSEPECVLCPLLPANAHRSLAELKRMGLFARLSDVGL